MTTDPEYKSPFQSPSEKRLPASVAVWLRTRPADELIRPRHLAEAASHLFPTETEALEMLERFEAAGWLQRAGHTHPSGGVVAFRSLGRDR